ncbi:RNA-binding protein [Rhodothermaceae bacterium RA]|nr:RNA-binding protein [Rhodothermaceae bacterium RA]
MQRRVLTYTLSFGCLIGLLMAGCTGADGPATPAPEASAPALPVRFTDVTAAAGLDGFRHTTGAFGEKWFPEAMGSGGGFVDVDGDGWIDIVLAGGGAWDQSPEPAGPPIVLYRNDGPAEPGQMPAFSDWTERAGLASLDTYSLGVLGADYDNDGDQDLFITTLYENLLLRNDDGVFVDVTARAGVGGEPTWSSSAIFFDADRDGWLDLYVGNYVKWSPETDIWCSLDGEQKGYCTPETYEGVPSRFYHNNGDGTFTDWTERAGFLPAPGKTLGVTELDVNNDGWPDLAVANDTQPDLLYVNNGDGTFTERGAVSGMAYDEDGKARAGMGIDAGVVDATGQVSLFVGNFSKEMIGVYRHLGNGLFIDRAAVSKIGRPSLLTLTFGLFLFDADLDGDLDLFAVNGHVQPEIETTQEGIGYAEAPHLFINRGDGTFEDLAPAHGGVMTTPIVARGAAYADVDHDGDLDVLVTQNDGPVQLWRNDVQTDHAYLRVHLKGEQSNRDGISARIVAVTGDVRQERRVRTGGSYLSQSELTATFGLGAAESVDTLIVAWPSGTVDRYFDVPGRQTVLVREGAPAVERWQPAAPGLAHHAE